MKTLFVLDFHIKPCLEFVSANKTLLVFAGIVAVKTIKMFDIKTKQP